MRFVVSTKARTFTNDFFVCFCGCDKQLGICVLRKKERERERERDIERVRKRDRTRDRERDRDSDRD
jgi:hypothetical protein